MSTISSKITIIDLSRIFVDGVEVPNVLTISVNKSKTVAIRVSDINCLEKAKLQEVGISVKVGSNE